MTSLMELSPFTGVASYVLRTEDSSVVDGRTDDQKVTGSSPGRSGRRIFLSRVSFVC